VHDPVALDREAQHEYGVVLRHWEDLPLADAIIAAVSHQAYLDMPPSQFLAKLVPGGVFADVKSCHDTAAFEAGGAVVWRL
jgi:UDP-N-acetyl-D-galactosamine dehydrogenase